MATRSKLNFPLRQLLDWYHKSKRELPWRRDPKPYNVWISEIMLQQTQVDFVLPYYKRFLLRFPDLRSLAGAKDEDVLTLWSGLGYYTRARNIHKTARILVRDYGGRFPRRTEDLLKLPGIGSYTAGAILSIAFDQPEPILDGNVRRVLSRYFLKDGTEDLWAASRKIILQAGALRMSPSDVNQGLMETGALVCLPKNPLCSSCPLSRSCQARKNGLQSSYPPARKRQKTVHQSFALAILQDDRSGNGHRNEILILRRSWRQRWLKNLWEFPMIPVVKDASPDRSTLSRRFAEKTGFPVRIRERLGNIRHTITHHQLEISVFDGTAGRTRESRSGPCLWAGPEKLKALSSSSILKKALALLR